MRRRAAVLLSLVLFAGVFGIGDHADAAVPRTYRNCAELNLDYPHGVARPGAVDVVRGNTQPVTTFVVNAAVYSMNTGRDGDRDGVACEKR